MEYFLAEGCKNTFVLFEALFQETLSEEFLNEAHAILVNEGRDDALILKNGKTSKDSLYVEMVVLGVDKELGEFCGNGARVCSAFLFENYPLFEEYYLVTKWGSHPIFRWGENQFSIKIPKPKLQINEKFVTSEELGDMRYVEVIEPHLIVEKEMSDHELFLLGQKLNAQKDVYPHGININAYQVLGDGILEVKTYERGVQRLTRSCGTGSTACAFAYQPNGETAVITSGGVISIISSGKEIELKGPACVEKK